MTPLRCRSRGRIVHGNFDSRSAVRRAVPGSLAGVCAGGHRVARPWDRRQHRHLQPADALLLTPMPVAEPERITAIYTSDFSSTQYGASSYPDFQDFRQRANAVADVTAYRLTPLSMNAGGDTEMAWVEAVSGNYFSLLGVGAVRGRVLIGLRRSSGRRSCRRHQPRPVDATVCKRSERDRSHAAVQRPHRSRLSAWRRASTWEVCAASRSMRGSRCFRRKR